MVSGELNVLAEKASTYKLKNREPLFSGPWLSSVKEELAKTDPRDREYLFPGL